MRRQSIILFLCLFVSIEMNAQIQRNFYDLSLGTSTQKEVQKYCKSNKKTILRKNSDGIYIKDLKFGGHTWPITLFSFYKGKLKTVFFTDIEEGTDRDALDLFWITLRLNIVNKYTEYADNKLSNDNLKYYDDGETTLMLSHKKTQDENGITLMYSDKKMQDAEIEEENNDL